MTDNELCRHLRRDRRQGNSRRKNGIKKLGHIAGEHKAFAEKGVGCHAPALQHARLIPGKLCIFKTVCQLRLCFKQGSVLFCDATGILVEKSRIAHIAYRRDAGRKWYNPYPCFRIVNVYDNAVWLKGLATFRVSDMAEYCFARR